MSRIWLIICLSKKPIKDWHCDIQLYTPCACYCVHSRNSRVVDVAVTRQPPPRLPSAWWATTTQCSRDLHPLRPSQPPQTTTERPPAAGEDGVAAEEEAEAEGPRWESVDQRLPSTMIRRPKGPEPRPGIVTIVFSLLALLSWAVWLTVSLILCSSGQNAKVETRATPRLLRGSKWD